MDAQKEILDAIEIIVDKKLKDVAQIYRGVVKSVSGTDCTISVNGEDYTMRYYGNPPATNLAYPVFVPYGNMSLAFIISP